MPEDIEARVTALEKELEGIRRLLSSLALESVEGDLNITYSAPSEHFYVRIDELSGDMSVGISAPSGRINIDTDDVGGDLCVSSSAPGDVNVSAQDVGGDLNCSGNVRVAKGGAAED